MIQERICDTPIQVGDLVAMEPHYLPHFTVIAISGDKAWLRNVQNGVDSLAFLTRCRKVTAAPSAE